MDVETKKPMTRDFVFRMASMTKPIIGTAIMMMLEEGKLQLADPVSKYISEFKNMKVAVPQGLGGRGAISPSSSTPFRLSIVAAAGLMFVATPMSAHHSFAGTYLEDAQPVTIEGTLVAFLVRNPHSFVHVEDATRKDSKGEPIRWSIEWGAAGQLAQQGVRTGSLKVGDKVKVTGSPGRNAEDYRLRMRSITRPSDGWTWPVGNQTFN